MESASVQLSYKIYASSMAGFPTKLNEINVQIYSTLKVKCLQRKPLTSEKNARFPFQIGLCSLVKHSLESLMSTH